MKRITEELHSFLSSLWNRKYNSSL